MTRMRRVDIAALAVLVAVVGGLALALWPRATETTTMASVAPPISTIDRSRPAAATEAASVLFIGDSYTAGNGFGEKSYGCMAAVRLDWVCHVAATPGTGYVSGGPANRFVVDPYVGQSTSLSERIPGLAVKYQPTVVVLDGGRNDLFPPRDDVFKAMVATVQEARRAWPTSTIVFIRPRFLADPTDDLGFDDAFMASLREAISDEDVVILDPLDEFAETDTSDMLRTDGIHPNQRGEQALASALLAALKGHGIAAAT